MPRYRNPLIPSEHNWPGEWLKQKIKELQEKGKVDGYIGFFRRYGLHSFDKLGKDRLVFYDNLGYLYTIRRKDLLEEYNNEHNTDIMRCEICGSTNNVKPVFTTSGTMYMCKHCRRGYLYLLKQNKEIPTDLKQSLMRLNRTSLKAKRNPKHVGHYLWHQFIKSMHNKAMAKLLLQTIIDYIKKDEKIAIYLKSKLHNKENWLVYNGFFEDVYKKDIGLDDDRLLFWKDVYDVLSHRDYLERKKIIKMMKDVFKKHAKSIRIGIIKRFLDNGELNELEELLRDKGLKD